MKCHVVKVSVKDTEKYQVVENKDHFRWSESGSARGAVIDALKCGVRFRDIDFGEFNDEIGFINLKKL